MIYYKQLSCDSYDEINQEILNYVLLVVDTNNTSSFWNPIPVLEFVKNTPLFQTWLKQQNIKIKALALTVGSNPHCCGPHVDTPPAVYKLSWPIQNSETTWNRWFRELADHCDVETNHLGGRQYNDITQLEEIARKRVDGPMIIHAGIPHDVWFEPGSQFPRLGLQCQLLKEPTEL